MAYAIIGVGLLALIMIAQKVNDIARLAVGAPSEIRAFLEDVAGGAWSRAKESARLLKPPTRELFLTGLQYCDSAQGDPRGAPRGRAAPAEASF